MDKILKILIALTFLVMGVQTTLLISVNNQIKRKEAMSAKDLALREAICSTEGEAREPCADKLLAGAESPTGVGLWAVELRRELGVINEDQAERIRMIWRSAYDRQAAGSIYSTLANICADALGQTCPDVLEIGSWTHQERLMESTIRTIKREDVGERDA